MKTIVVMPAYNAETTLEKTVADVPLDYVDEIILVDDASQDQTVEIGNKIKFKYADKIPITIAIHKENKGYGGNQKKCYDLAIDHGGEIIIMLHPDYQYDPKLIPFFRKFIEEGYFDCVLGSRIRSRKEALNGGMPLYKYIANRILSFIENVVSGQNLSEWHTGMRAYKAEVLNNIDYKDFSDDFIFDTQMLFAIFEKGHKVGDIPVPVRYFKDSSSINFWSSVKYGVATLLETTKFLLRKILK